MICCVVACIGIFGQFQPTTAQHHRRHPSYSHPLASSKSDKTEWSNSVETNSSQSGTGPGLYNIVDYATYARRFYVLLSKKYIQNF